MLEDFLKLPAKDRALIAYAVLLDGIDAETYIGSDANEAGFVRFASWFARMPIEMRMPYIGSLLRRALSEMNAEVA